MSKVVRLRPETWERFKPYRREGEKKAETVNRVLNDALDALDFMAASVAPKGEPDAHVSHKGLSAQPGS